MNLTKAVRRNVSTLVFDKVLEGYFLNLVGLQIARILLGRIILKLRRSRLRGGKGPNVKALLDDGIVVIQDFLDEADFSRVRKEFRDSFDAGVGVYSRDIRLGVRKINFRDSIPRFTKSRLFEHPALKALFRYGEAREIVFRGCVFEESIFAENTDPQQVMHRDNFYSTHKAFFYIDDVDVRDGPFVYVKGSNKVSFKRLLHEYLNGLSRSRNKTLRFQAHHARVVRWIERSLRKKEIHTSAPKNTLIVVDTFGYHRRGDTAEGAQRQLIRVAANFNPFMPRAPMREEDQ